MEAPPRASASTCWPIAPWTRFGPPRPMKLVPSTMRITSLSAGRYAPPAMHCPITAEICGILNWRRMRAQLWKIRAPPYLPGNVPCCSGRNTPAESTRYTIGMPQRIAASWMRSTFETVSGNQLPAFTVASLAITATCRPPTRPIPVTTPAAGAMPPWALRAMSRPSSSSCSPSSSRAAMRSRASSFPTLRCRSIRLGPPPSRTASSSSCKSAISPRM